MSDFLRGISIRNARFRAWKTYGVPVMAEWWYDSQSLSSDVWKVYVKCVLCDVEIFSGLPYELRHLDVEQLKDYDKISQLLGKMEKYLVDELISGGCRHLIPLTVCDPEELDRLIGFELLKKTF
jgi:hypothetical protein